MDLSPIFLANVDFGCGGLNRTEPEKKFDGKMTKRFLLNLKSFLVWMLRKATTKPIWWWERRFRYSVQREYMKLTPIGGNGNSILAVLTTPSTFDEALFAAWSWLRFLHLDFKLTLYVDGTVTDEMISKFSRIFPDSTVQSAKEYLLSLVNASTLAYDL